MQNAPIIVCLLCCTSHLNTPLSATINILKVAQGSIKTLTFPSNQINQYHAVSDKLCQAYSDTLSLILQPELSPQLQGFTTSSGSPQVGVFPRYSIFLLITPYTILRFWQMPKRVKPLETFQFLDHLHLLVVWKY